MSITINSMIDAPRRQAALQLANRPLQTPSRLNPRWNHEPGSRLTPRWTRLAVAIRNTLAHTCCVASAGVGDASALRNTNAVLGGDPRPAAGRQLACGLAQRGRRGAGQRNTARGSRLDLARTAGGNVVPAR